MNALVPHERCIFGTFVLWMEGIVTSVCGIVVGPREIMVVNGKFYLNDTVKFRLLYI